LIVERNCLIPSVLGSGPATRSSAAIRSTCESTVFSASPKSTEQSLPKSLSGCAAQGGKSFLDRRSFKDLFDAYPSKLKLSLEEVAKAAEARA